jgi:hypothetical protein
MKKIGLMTVAGFIFSSMMVMACYAHGTGGAWSSSAGKGSTINLEMSSGSDRSDWGMNSDEGRTFGVSPDYRDKDFDLHSDQDMDADQGRTFGVSPEYRDKDFDLQSNQDLNTDQDRTYGISPDFRDKDLDLHSDEGEIFSDQGRSYGISPDYGDQEYINTD